MAEPCAKCDRAVYCAEKATLCGKHGEVWHKQCLKCENCNKRLDSTTFTENKGTPYCKACYAKVTKFAGYGYGQGAGTFHYTS